MKSIVIHAIWFIAALFSHNGWALDVPPVVNYSFDPPNPTINDVVRFRMDVDGCFHHPFGAELISEEAAIEVRITGEDFPCDPSNPENLATPRFYDVGQLPAGVYATRVLFCVPGPPEGYICDTLQEGALVVSGPPSPLPSIIPALSSPALAILVLLSLGVGLVVFRRG